MFSSIRSKLLVLTIIPIIVVALVYTVPSILDIISSGNKSVENFKAELLEQRRDQVASQAKLGFEILKSFKKDIKEPVRARADEFKKFIEAEYQKLKEAGMDDETIKEILIQTSNAYIFWEGRGYIFGYDISKENSAIALINGANPKLRGKDLWNLKDKKDNLLLHILVKAAKDNSDKGGYCEYYWPNPGNKDAVEAKLSYSFIFNPSPNINWMMGLGEYISTLEQKNQNDAIHALKKLRFSKNDEGYYFVYKADGTAISVPGFESLQGQNLIDKKDNSGVAYIKMLLDNSKKGGGFSEYLFPHKEGAEPKPKISYSLHYPDWDWMIGTGAYMDDIDILIQKEREKVDGAVSSFILRSIIISATILAIAIFAVINLSNRLFVSNIFKLREGLSHFFDYLHRKRVDVKYMEIKGDDEIAQMGKLINESVQAVRTELGEEERLIQDATEVLEQVMAGHLSNRIQKETSNPTLEKLKDVINKMLDELDNTIMGALNTFDKYRDNDYTAKVQTKALEGKLGSLIENIDLLGESLRGIFLQNLQNGKMMESQSELLSSTSVDLTTTSKKQAVVVEQARSATDNMSETVGHTNELSNQMVGLADDIKNVVGIIQDIADQTNLLALNAAIEAARAGEHGRGFAVVSDEVRKLAERTQKSLSEVSTIINSLTQSVTEVNESLKAQTKSITDINAVFEDIEMGSRETTMKADEVSHIANEVNDVAKKLVLEAMSKKV